MKQWTPDLMHYSQRFVCVCVCVCVRAGTKETLQNIQFSEHVSRPRSETWIPEF